MRSRSRQLYPRLAGWVTIVVASLVASVAAGGPSADPLRAEIDALRLEIARHHGRGTPMPDLDAIRALVDDADRRTTFRDGLVAGWDRHFMLQAPDGDFRLRLRGQLQARYVFVHRDHAESSGALLDDTSRGGFEQRRSRIELDGFVGSPQLTWRLELLAGTDGVPELQNAFIAYEFDRGWSLRVGQFKPSFTWERLRSTRYQLAVDRSAVDALFNVGRSQGVELSREDDRLRVSATFHDGDGAANGPALLDDVEYAVAARIDLLASGAWKQFDDYVTWSDDETGLRFGVGAAIQQRDPVAAPDERQSGITADMQWETRPFSVFAAVVHDVTDTSGAERVRRWGAVASVATWLVPDELDVFGRIEWADLDIAGADDLRLATVGVNRYLKRHALKWTTEVGVSWGDVPTTSLASSGWDVARDGHTQVVFRTQFQLLF